MSESKEIITSDAFAAFMADHGLPDAFESTVRDFYEPLARQLPEFRAERKTLLLGINGAQGTGKSTLAEFLALAAAELFAWRTAVLSIDDFYLTRAERIELADEVHHLFVTRGVPGTHDTDLLSETLDEIAKLEAGQTTRLPRFDKAIDDRAAEDRWPLVEGPLDLIILEGWCVGSSADEPANLAEPVNELESHEDADGTWRRYANARLSVDYEPIFAQLDALVFLAAPSFNAILEWRIEQEHKLAKKSAGSRIMSDEEVARFINFYERITRHNLETMPARADVIFELNTEHGIAAANYATPARETG